MDLLTGMMERQAAAQAQFHSGDDKIERIRWNILALEDELHEALNEVGWKPWAESRHINEAAFKSELIDAWHFMMNLFEIAGMDAGEVALRYHAKREKNDLRQVNGYDGVSGKCSVCKRALDDEAVRCTDAECFA